LNLDERLVADSLFLLVLVSGIVLVFPWCTSTYAHSLTNGKFPVLGQRTAQFGAVLLATSVLMAMAQMVLPGR